MSALLIIQSAVSADREHRARYRRYQALVQPLIEACGGRLRASGLDLVVLEGKHDGRRLLIFEFSSMDALRAFWQSAQYAEIRPLRAGAASVDVWAVPAQ